MNKYLSRFCLICLMVFLCFINVDAMAAEEYTEGELIYIIEDESITITGYFGNDEEVFIPAMIGGLPVSKIAENAFAGKKIIKIHLPETIMSIEADAIPQSATVNYEDEEMNATHNESIIDNLDSSEESLSNDSEEFYQEGDFTPEEMAEPEFNENQRKKNDQSITSQPSETLEKKESLNRCSLYIFTGIVVIIISVVGINMRRKRNERI